MVIYLALRLTLSCADADILRMQNGMTLAKNVMFKLVEINQFEHNFLQFKVLDFKNLCLWNQLSNYEVSCHNPRPVCQTILNATLNCFIWIIICLINLD